MKLPDAALSAVYEFVLWVYDVMIHHDEASALVMFVAAVFVVVAKFVVAAAVFVAMIVFVQTFVAWIVYLLVPLFGLSFVGSIVGLALLVDDCAVSVASFVVVLLDEYIVLAVMLENFVAVPLLD